MSKQRNIRVNKLNTKTAGGYPALFSLLLKTLYEPDIIARVMRAFVSINLPYCSCIDRFLEDLNNAGVRTGKTSQFHITLKFLGDISDQQIPAIINALEDAASKTVPFDIDLNKTGTFSRKDGSGIIWIGSDSKESGRLASLVDENLSRLNFEKESRPFNTHITVARVKKDVKNIEELLRFKKYEFGRIHVSSLFLMKSRLTPDGPVYSVVKEMPLG